MKVECQEIEQLLGSHIERSLTESEYQKVNLHLETCKACAQLSIHIQSVLSLCKSFPEIDPPARLMERILVQTIGSYKTFTWIEYLRELFRPLYSSPRFATGACVAIISLSIVMNALGVNLSEIRWNSLTRRNVVESLYRTVNIAYDNSVRRINDLKILYQIQSKFEEMRSEETKTKKETEGNPKNIVKPQENSATEHLVALEALIQKPPSI